MHSPTEQNNPLQAIPTDMLRRIRAMYDAGSTEGYPNVVFLLDAQAIARELRTRGEQ